MGRPQAQSVAAGEPDRDVPQPERPCYVLDDRGQHRLGRERPLQTPPQPREDPVRLVPLAVRQAVHAALQPVPQRSKKHRDDAGGDEGDEQVAFHEEERDQERHPFVRTAPEDQGAHRHEDGVDRGIERCVEAGRQAQIPKLLHVFGGQEPLPQAGLCSLGAHRRLDLRQVRNLAGDEGPHDQQGNAKPRHAREEQRTSAQEEEAVGWSGIGTLRRRRESRVRAQRPPSNGVAPLVLRSSILI